MAQYQVLARKYRPQTFNEVLGQEAVVTTLKNAIRMCRLAHAYLFCGSRGTGKTTLARVFAKALNCQNPTPEGEPCNVCSSCKEIGSGNSLDILEIDGASHRGIDDIRQINDTVGYSSSSGKYKIFIIDEVHMLTKEAFNALLKTLEEPPAKVLFIFATTEPHKVLPTILSRCQRFNLSRIPLETIMAKLRRIAQEQNIEIDEEAIYMLAQRADGGLRDAESLFDQIIAFHEGRITTQIVGDVLGVMPKEILFQMDQAGKEGRLDVAFDIVQQIFSQGKDIIQFVETMTEHFRTLLLIKMAGTSAPFLSLIEVDKPRYEASAKIYTQEQCLTILDLLIEAQNQIRFQSSGRIALEAILLRVMRTHQRLPIGFLVKRLAELEQAVQGTNSVQPPEQIANVAAIAPVVQNNIPQPVVTPQPIPKPPVIQEVKPEVRPVGSITEDPSPTAEELGIKKKPQKKATAVAVSEPNVQVQKVEPPTKVADTPASTTITHKQSHYDTLLHFAAVELEGTVKKK